MKKEIFWFVFIFIIFTILFNIRNNKNRKSEKKIDTTTINIINDTSSFILPDSINYWLYIDDDTIK